MTIRLLLLPGDGIGPEIATATRRVLEAADRRFGLDFTFEEAAIGFASLEREGTTFPPRVLELARAADGVILGPVSHAEYPRASEGGINPSGGLRTGLDLYANIRPSRTMPSVPAVAAAMDLVLVRENTEGFYADRTMHAGSGEFMPTADLAMALRKVTRAGSARIARAAGRIATARRQQVTIVHKANVLKLSDGLFLATVKAVLSEEFAGLVVDDQHVDAMASLLVRDSERFDVIVTTNMFGDILSNLAAELAGGLGLAASLNHGDEHAVAQAAHGSAPDIAGRDVANPTSLILSAAMLLRDLGERRSEARLEAAAGAIERAVEAQLAEPGRRTSDLGGPLGTTAFAEALCARLERGEAGG
ncbi:MAG TPA: isocitrate/isopropylmalate dehydrogenase family protein [Geminicoccaceae bacterium]|nr:isocitrate/isopropylmalate dehydrogenase family protein [Geminicoccaceae bacterium]